jgi:hypothetical protein
MLVELDALVELDVNSGRRSPGVRRHIYIFFRLPVYQKVVYFSSA